MSSGSDKERETFVYTAKLSEQAERYDGSLISIHSLISYKNQKLQSYGNEICRDGWDDEESGESGQRADSGGEEPVVGWVQERDRSKTGFVEDNVVDRAEGRV